MSKMQSLLARHLVRRTRRAAHALPGLLALAVSLGACAHGPSTAGPPSSPPMPVARVTSDDEFSRLRDEYEVMTPGSPARVATRDALEAWALDEARRDLAADRLDEAWDEMTRALSLWDAVELKHGPRDPALLAAAEELERLFRRRGAHRETLTLLGAQIALRPEEPQARGRFDAAVAWLRGDENESCNQPGCDKLIEDLEAAVLTFPSPFLVDQLAVLYWQRQAGATTLGSGERPTSLRDLLRRRSAQNTAVALTRLYLRVSEPDKAQAALARLTNQPGDDPGLREALERALSSSARPMDAVSLASRLSREAPHHGVGLRICRDAARRFPSSAEPQLCIGELAIKLDQLVLAIFAFERAVELSPDKRDAWEALARLRQARLSQLAGDERTDLLESELSRVEALHAEVRRRFPGDPLKPSLAGAFYEVGRGFYLTGHIEEATRYLVRARDIQPLVAVEEQLAIIAWRDGRGAEAVSRYRAALDLLRERARAAGKERDGGEEVWRWMGKIQRGLADALEASGNLTEAMDARRRSLEAWDRLLLSQRDTDEVAESLMERARLLYTLGERERGIAAIQRAIDAQPERGSTYAEALAFLAPRGELGEALDAYHRALGRPGVSEYIKIYASLWVLDLARRLGEPEDPLARQFLETVRGPRWHHALAGWASGRGSDEELAARADTAAKRCELDFYRAMRELAQGRIEAARPLWRRVLESRMMAFYEYDMASWFLRHEPQPGHARTAEPAAPTVRTR